MMHSKYKRDDNRNISANLYDFKPKIVSCLEQNAVKAPMPTGTVAHTLLTQRFHHWRRLSGCNGATPPGKRSQWVRHTRRTIPTIILSIVVKQTGRYCHHLTVPC